MKFTKKCLNTKNRRRSSAGMFYTSSAGAVTSLILCSKKGYSTVTSLILMLALPLLFGLLSLTGATNLFGLNGSVHATASTLTISVTDMVSLNIASPDDTGNFATSDTSTNNISVKTTNGTGYELGIKAKTNNSNALINSSDSSKTIPSITTSISESTYSTNSAYNNTWGFRPSKINSQANSNYLQAPTSASTTTTLDKTSAANPSTANTYNLAIGTRVNSSTTPGSYSNVFVITVTANPIPYTITYNKNTTDTVTNMPANVSSSTYSETVTISNQAPARGGFNFKGWCTVQVADGGTCTGTTYNPDGGGTNLTWTLNQTSSSNSLTIYAMWEEVSKVLYDKVASMSKGKQTEAQLRTAIDTSNSGVYEYDASVFGAASDASNDYAIYYYRGILDNTTGTYGSDGDNAAYPNTVVLSSASSKGSLTTSDTCWRIVRTTGSGGVKMIYQGKWTGSTCANSGDNAQVAKEVFGGTATAVYGSIVGTGYTRNNEYASLYATTATAYSTIFGSNSSYSSNSTASDMKTYIEGTWFSNINSYASKLEQSAGWCNDRSIRESSSSTSVIPDSTKIVPYGTKSMTQYYFGSRVRTNTTSDKPTLGCPRNNADLYTTSSATNGNKQLGKPAALITADEAAFAGSGSYSSTTPYHANSYLRSGSGFWLLSPFYRYSDGTPYGFYLTSSGYLINGTLLSSYGVRPAISLKPGSEAVSGSGTAADPWIMNPGASTPTMQTVTSSDLATLMPNEGDTTTLEDERDGNEYQITKINGNYWMTQNLRITGTIQSEGSNFNNVSSWKVDQGDLDSTITPSGYASYTDPRIHSGTDSSGNPTMWYNFCAATAGYDHGCDNNGYYTAGTGDVTGDICPYGWRLPTNSEFTGIISYASQFNIVKGGNWYNGTINSTTTAYWWSSTPETSYNYRQYYLVANASNVLSTTQNNTRRGEYIRCIKR